MRSRSFFICVCVVTDAKYCLDGESRGREGRILYISVDFSGAILISLQEKSSTDDAEHERKRLLWFVTIVGIWFAISGLYQVKHQLHQTGPSTAQRSGLKWEFSADLSRVYSVLYWCRWDWSRHRCGNALPSAELPWFLKSGNPEYLHYERKTEFLNVWLDYNRSFQNHVFT